MKNIVVFCGSSMGKRAIYKQVASEMGRSIAKMGCRLIYGGGCLGLMHEVSEAALVAGGEVIGIIPSFFTPEEVGEKLLTVSISVETLPERKERMMEMADGFVILPGGLGTLDELYEVLAAKQLKQLHAPIGILNVEGFYNQTMVQLDKMVEEGFLKQEHRDLLIEAETPVELLQKMSFSFPSKAENLQL